MALDKYQMEALEQFGRLAILIDSDREAFANEGVSQFLIFMANAVADHLQGKGPSALAAALTGAYALNPEAFKVAITDLHFP